MKGMILIGKLITTLLTALLAFCIIANASATSSDFITEEINHCQHRREVAHQMAECARELGYAEDHPVILAAKESWQKNMDRETELNKLIPVSEPIIWDGPILTRSKGVNYGPSGKETYYNLPMGGVVRIMRNMGFSASKYPYWVRNDGVKMLGDYVLCACNLSIHPRGSLVETSLGIGICADTGGFAKYNPTQIDIATSWG